MNFRLISILIFVACSQPKGELKETSLSMDQFRPYINKSTNQTPPNLSIIKNLYNDDYPIEISLFEDGTWYYNLENLGDGYGTWTFSEGKIKLFAKRRLFDMHIELKAISENELIITFSDRFGPKVLRMFPRNL